MFSRWRNDLISAPVLIDTGQGYGACSVGGARLYTVVFIFLEQLRKHLRAARLASHLAPDDDALARCHGNVTRRASRLTEAALDAMGGIGDVLDRGGRLKSPQMDSRHRD